MEESIEVQVTVHWPEGGSGRLYTLRCKSNGEFVSLLLRLKGYAFKEEQIVVGESDDLLDKEQIQREQEALTWRMNMLNKKMMLDSKKREGEAMSTYVAWRG